MDSYFATMSDSGFLPDPDDNIMNSLFQQYERVIVESLITSFGLDFLIKDQHGGDVDTIHNVRQIGNDEQMSYKNSANKSAYNERGTYSSTEYHRGGNYQEIKHNAREEYRTSGTTVTDAYTGKELHFLGNSKNAPAKINAELDHVIAAKSIHEDRGRVLSGLKGKDLANSPENLQFTNKSLNASMQAKEIPDYIADNPNHPDLTDEVKANMMHHYNKSKSTYEAKLAQAYYTSPQFAEDTAKAAATVGFKMGVRQAVGLVFTEIWFSVKEEFNLVTTPFEMNEFLNAIGNGIAQGFANAKSKYKDVLNQFKAGAISGVLSSLTTTLCNIFFTTAKNIVKIIRQSYACLVQAAELLFLNPDNLPFGERMLATSKILATGASVVVGTLVTDAIGNTGINAIPALANIVPVFCGTLVTGILTCSLLYFLDRSERMNQLVSVLNNVPSVSAEVNYYKQQALYFEHYAAELMQIDLQKFKNEVEMYSTLATNLNNAQNETELNAMLKNALKIIGVSIPWTDDFNSFMSDKSKVLVFE